MTLSQGFQQDFSKYSIPPGVSVPTEYVQVIPVYTTITEVIQKYNRKIHRVAPNGNCLFRALSHQAFGEQMYHAQMRKSLVTFISGHMDKYQAFYIGRNSFSEHIRSRHMGYTIRNSSSSKFPWVTHI